MDFAWLPKYAPVLIEGFWRTLILMGLSGFFGFLLAIPVGLAQTRPGLLAML